METPYGRRSWRVPALTDAGGAVVASMDLYETSLRLGHRRLRLGGIGCFNVRTDLRRSGLGRRLVDLVHARLRDEGFDGALLFSCIGEAYYERLGYETLPMLRLEADVTEWRTAGRPETSSEIRAYADVDFEDVRNLYNTASALQELSVLRDEDTWGVELLRARLVDELAGRQARPWSFLVGARDGRVVSYLRSHWNADRRVLTVLELAFEPGCREDVTASLFHVLDAIQPEGAVRLTAVAPTRLANLVPTRRLRWIEEHEDILMMLSFGSHAVPTDLPHDARLIWQSDWF
jgi:N-acetylglutamate synthase-like GNAT family acetyltransferase